MELALWLSTDETAREEENESDLCRSTTYHSTGYLSLGPVMPRDLSNLLTGDEFSCGFSNIARNRHQSPIIFPEVLLISHSGLAIARTPIPLDPHKNIYQNKNMYQV